MIIVREKVRKYLLDFFNTKKPVLSMRECQNKIILFAKLRKFKTRGQEKLDFNTRFLERICFGRQGNWCLLYLLFIFVVFLHNSDFRFVLYTPSMIAAGAVCAAMAGFQHEVQTTRLEMLGHMHQITNIEQVCQDFIKKYFVNIVWHLICDPFDTLIFKYHIRVSQN